MNFLEKINQGKRIFVFIGEAGSGKSEIAINLALLVAETGRNVQFFDMDQTKPLFRSRELAGLLQANRVLVDTNQQMLDSPTVPNGVFDRIQDEKVITILDVGGNAGGARTLGQLKAAWGKVNSINMVVNTFRPFSSSQSSLIHTLAEIAAAARVENVSVISNPNIGEQTTLQDVTDGHRQLEELLKGSIYGIDLLVVSHGLVEDVRSQFPDIDIFKITRYMKAPWERRV